MFRFLKRNKKQEEQPTMPNFAEILASIEKLSDEEKKQIHEKTGEAVADNKDESAPETTTEEVAKAKEDIKEDGKDSQSEKDRVDESVAAQEANKGDEDSQDAKDRVDEAEGEDKYIALKKDHEDLRAEFEALKQQFAEAQSKPREVDKDEAKKLDDIRRTYLN